MKLELEQVLLGASPALRAAEIALSAQTPEFLQSFCR